MRLLSYFHFVVVFFVIFSVYSSVFAASSSFPITAFVGDDTDPPTVPVIQSVVPASATQINIAWSASTDNVLLLGYRLFRGGTQIATTSLTTFNDTGLTPETLYSYSVDAFDSYGNISSSSLPVATTTLAVPVVPPPATTTASTTRSTSGTLVTHLDSFTLQTTERSARFMWETNMNTRYTLQWGRTTSYELGSVSTNIFNQAHETTIENLEPGTRYWYSITSNDGRGVSSATKQGEFTTLPVAQSTLPANVRQVVATVDGVDVVLHWQNPVLDPGATIRVVRNHLFFPMNPTDGALVYEGPGTNVRDSRVLERYSRQYYTIFVMSGNGAVSSGAVTLASKAGSATSVGTTSIVTPPVILEDTGDMAVLKADAVIVRQGIVSQTIATPLILDFDQPYVVYIPVGAVTTHLKSIIITVQDPTDQRQSTSYLLKLNQGGDAYEAVIEPPHVSGASRAIVEVFDFNQASVRRIVTPITFVAPKTTPVVFPDDVVRYGQLLIPAILFGGFILVSLFWLLLFLRRRREDKQ